MNIAKWVLAALAALAGAGAAAAALWPSLPEASAIGVIGGADGPTAIYVAVAVKNPAALLAGLALLLAVAAAIVWWAAHKQNTP